MASIVAPEGEKPAPDTDATVQEAAFDGQGHEQSHDDDEAIGLRPQDQEGDSYGLKVIENGVSIAASDDVSGNEPQPIAYDVVAIHGLNGTSSGSWTKSPNKTWLNDAFSDTTDNKGRIMSYEYRTDIDTGRYYTPYGIYEEAEALLKAVQELRAPDIRESRRPVYFFSHDIGGAIVKAALSIATQYEDKYADILHSTRAMYFFGYPHRYLSSDSLEEAILRLVVQEHDRWSGNTVWYAKNLAQTVMEVNDAFLQTQMLTQANFINVVSNQQEDTAQQVFPVSMSSMGTPFERLVRLDRPHRDLTSSEPDGSHPADDIADKDWLTGNLTGELHLTFRKMLNHASPVFPYRSIDTGWQHEDLLDLPKLKDDLIIHMRCPYGAAEAAERASFYLDNNRSGTFQPLLYMKFAAHDVRFNSCEAMLRTFLTRLLCNRLENNKQTVYDTMESLARIKTLALSRLFDEWEFFRSLTNFKESIHVLGCFDECNSSALWFLSEIKKYLLRSESCLKIVIITTKGSPGDGNITSSLSELPSKFVRSIEYHPEKPPAFPVDMQVSKLIRDRMEYLQTDQHRDIRQLLTTCADDHELCEIIIEWLKTAKQPSSRISTLLSQPLTPELAFSTVLEEMPESRRPWAKNILSWTLACQRPLRIDEFADVSENTWVRGGGEKNQLGPETVPRRLVADTLQYFCGLLMIENGEIRFRHPAMRAWLTDQQRAGNEETWYRRGTETQLHEEVLRTCMDYLRNEAENEDGSARQFPYAIEFWPKHWQLVGSLEKQGADLFENESRFQRWANALVNSPTPFLKPLPDHIKPLPVAAHLGLTDAVELLLQRHLDNAEQRGQALVEAARAGQVAAIQLLVDSYPSGLDFDDEYLHEATRVAGYSGSNEALRELVMRIPEPPYTIPSRVAEKEELKNVQEPSQSEHRDHLPDEPPNEAVGDETDDQDTQVECETDGSPDEQQASNPFRWLAIPLYRAALEGLEDVVARLLSLGAELNPPKGVIPNDQSALQTAVSHSHSSCVKLLIDAGASLTARDSGGDTALHAAAAWSSGETVKLLLESGIGIGDRNTDNEFMALSMAAEWGAWGTLEAILLHRDHREYFVEEPERHPVNLAVENDNKKCLKMLLNHGLNPNIPNYSGLTPLKAAIRNGRMDLCHMLLDNNADPDLAPDRIYTPLIQAIAQANLDMVKLLVDRGATIDKSESPGHRWLRTPMHIAIYFNEPEIVKYLLQQGANPNIYDLDGWPAISTAAERGYTDMVRWLAEAKADLEVTYKDQNLTTLHVAVSYPETVRVLIQHGADTGKVSTDSRTPLDAAIFQNKPETVRVLLEEPKTKPDLSLSNTQKELRGAVIAGFTEVVGALLEAGADVNIVDEENQSLLCLAMKYSPEADIVRTILEYNPDLEISDHKQNTALHCITPVTSLEAVRRVVNAGGRLDALNASGITPLISAIRAGLESVVFYMLKKKAALHSLQFLPLEQTGTALHEACRFGSLEMVQLLIEHGMYINFCCDGIYGTPLISATLRPAVSLPHPASALIEFFLKEGADPTIPAGLFGYPIISACLSCPTDVIQKLLDSEVEVSVDVSDPLGRKPVHMACYNSLDVLNILDVPDSEFAVRDLVGRVPLHYAVMSEDVGLVEEVLARSQRAGLNIDVEDYDGWTPLLWAVRASRIWNRAVATHSFTSDVASFLLSRGASPTAKGQGLYREWTVREVAYYHHADNSYSLDDLGQGSNEKNSQPRRRGKIPEFQGNETFFCHCCLLQSPGVYFKCSLCFDYTLCYKCYRSRLSIHQPSHSFIELGGEWDEEVEPQEEVPDVPAVADTELLAGSEGETPANEFDDEIIG